VFESGWQTRYYKAFFEPSSFSVDAVCINYLEGLEWTMKYYTEGCADWRWSYKYNYPPLLEDLIRFVPLFDKEFIVKKAPNPVTPVVQLSYVLPRSSLHMLPPLIKAVLLKEHSDWYPEDCDYYWAFCKYFWESHANLPEIDVDELEALVLSDAIHGQNNSRMARAQECDAYNDSRS
jgi:5'-3' exoribonuclease 2